MINTRIIGGIKLNGKQLRLARLINPATNRCSIVPIDHGTTFGPIDGLKDYICLTNKIIDGGADAIIMHKGLLRAVAKYPKLARGKYIMHLSASTMLNSDPTNKVLVSSVEEAIKLGADGVSVQVNLGVPTESNMIKDLGMVSKACLEWGMPLLVMIYSHSNTRDAAHEARVAEELGADIVKINYPGSAEKVEQVVKGVNIPVLIAGGNKLNVTEELFIMINNALNSGASGIAIGRNIFQYEDPQLITSLVSKLVHGIFKIEECLFQLKRYNVSVKVCPEGSL